ncbi:hypothetical protein AVEN_216603-1 [Araneus ventricosus]|uniref:Uncharacterized protein n=1 Tax=Araneus ventricosus TaxID=182803 RepID=A0A4Y2WJ38_ARAVE|nr:hypothetical protein AVEN_216603-1 [Araneus ventricosus]
MDRLQRQPSHNIFNNNEDQNISWDEKHDKVFSPSDFNEFEKLALSVDFAAGNPYLGTSDDVEEGGRKPRHYNYQESKQRNTQLSKENANFAFMNTSNLMKIQRLTYHLTLPSMTHSEKILSMVYLWVVKPLRNFMRLKPK